MTNVVSTYKECLKHLKELQDGPREATVANYCQVAAKCNKLRQASDQAQDPPKATWKRLVLDMQASAAHNGLPCCAAELLCGCCNSTCHGAVCSIGLDCAKHPTAPKALPLFATLYN
jgi:hypothetical protein